MIGNGTVSSNSDIKPPLYGLFNDYPRWRTHRPNCVFCLNPYSKFHNTLTPSACYRPLMLLVLPCICQCSPPPTHSLPLFVLSRTEEPAKADTCARDGHALQQLALNVHDLTWPDVLQYTSKNQNVWSKACLLNFAIKDIIFSWVPSHTGIRGNKEADWGFGNCFKS